MNSSEFRAFRREYESKFNRKLVKGDRELAKWKNALYPYRQEAACLAIQEMESPSRDVEEFVGILNVRGESAYESSCPRCDGKRRVYALCEVTQRPNTPAVELLLSSACPDCSDGRPANTPGCRIIRLMSMREAEDYRAEQAWQQTPEHYGYATLAAFMSAALPEIIAQFRLSWGAKQQAGATRRRPVKLSDAIADSGIEEPVI